MDLEEVVKAAELVAAKYKLKKDQASWTAWKEELNEVGNWKNTACYDQVMGFLGSLEIHCLPWGGPSKGQMPALWYHYFFRLLKRSGIVPPEVKTLHRKGAHCLIIPRTGWDRHTIYITLCYYRLVDQRPNEAMRIMSLYKRLIPPGTNFLQCLHYGIVTTKVSPGHQFLVTGPYGGIHKLDLAAGQALAYFSRLSKAQRLKAIPSNVSMDNSNFYTSTYLTKEAREMKSIRVERASEILNPKYAYLYEKPRKESK